MVSSRTTRYHLRTIKKSESNINTLEKVRRSLISDLKMNKEYNHYYVHSYNYLYERYSNLLSYYNKLYHNHSNLLTRHDKLWDINDDLSFKLENVRQENEKLTEEKDALKNEINLLYSI